MQRKMKKQYSERWHFKRRILERYGIFCNRFLYRDLIGQIQNKLSRFIGEQTNTRTVHAVRVNLELCEDSRTNLRVPLETDGTIKLYAVYDKLRHEIVTCLPWFENDDLFLEYLSKRYNTEDD